MRLNDWKRQAEEYRDIDRAAQATAKKEIAARKPAIVAHYKIGRCANGAERDAGFVRHAIERGAWTALCGAKPGRSSAGWSHEGEPVERVSCQKCLRKLAALSPATNPNEGSK